MRERGVQSRRLRESKEGIRRPAPTSSGTNMWQVIAIVALLAATAGWTTVAVIALRGSDLSAAITEPSDAAVDPGASDEPSDVPEADTHDAPDLELALPAAVNGVTLKSQSVTGEGLLSDDAWSTTVTTFLTSVGKTAKDLQFAQAADPDESLDGSFEVYRLPGVDAVKLRDTLIAAWKGDFPDMKVTDVTVGGQQMIKGEFDTETPPSYLYAKGEYLYDIWTTDPAIAESAIKALPVPGATAAPHGSAAPSASPAASSKPTASASPAP